MTKITLGVAVAMAALALVVSLFVRPNVEAPAGANAGSEFFNMAQFYAGSRESNHVSTSTNSSATLTANEFRGWASASEVSLVPNVTAAATFTFPASSTVPDIVPNAGDKQEFCVRNATTTSGIYLTLAGSTGINLTVASSSVSALGGKVLLSGKVGCITLIRQKATATTFDIDALLTVYQ